MGQLGLQVIDKRNHNLYNEIMNIVNEASQLVNEDRQKVYGHPSDDFAKVATMTQPIMESTIDPRLKHALYMIQVKIARLLNTPNHHDSIVDIIGYVNTYNMILEKDEKDSKALDEVPF